MSNRIPDEIVAQAKEISVLDYFETFKSGDLHWSGGSFRSKEHPSFCVKDDGYVFHWKSQGISGWGALDYLQKCEGLSFRDAVQRLTGTNIEMVRTEKLTEQVPALKIPFCLPERNYTNRNAIDYLYNRGISEEVINYCIDKGFVYQSREYSGAVLIGYDNSNHPLYITRDTYNTITKSKDIDDVVTYCTANYLLLSPRNLSNLKQVSNVVFVGYNTKTNEPAYAAKRGMYNKIVYDENGNPKNKSFRQEVTGSKKDFGFAMRDVSGKSKTVHVFEAAIDAMSYATLIQLYSSDFNKKNLLSLGGAQSGKQSKFKGEEEVSLPLALEEFISSYSQNIEKVFIHFDNDDAGVKHSQALKENLAKRGIESEIKLPPSGKDVNDFLKATLEKLNHEKGVSAREVLSRS